MNSLCRPVLCAVLAMLALPASARADAQSSAATSIQPAPPAASPQPAADASIPIIGVKVGLSRARFIGGELAGDITARAGEVVGAFFAFPSTGRFSAVMEILFIPKGAGIDDGSAVHLDYTELLLLARFAPKVFRLGPTATARPYLVAGGFFGVERNSALVTEVATDLVSSENLFETTSGFDLGAAVGIGVQLRSSFVRQANRSLVVDVEVRACQGIVNMGPEDQRYGYNTTYLTIFGFRY